MKILAFILALALTSCSSAPKEEPHGWQRPWWGGEPRWVPPLGDDEGGIHR